MDMGADDAADGQWMTYAELGLARGISKESALKLALRRKWRKQDDNRGHVRVYVPADWASKRDVGADAGADISRAIGALEGAVTALREQLVRESARADAAEAGREIERAKAEAEIAALRVQLAQAQAEARQSPQVRRLLGLIARLRAEWRG